MKAELTPPVVAGQRTGQVRERGYAHIWIPAGAALRPSTALLLGDVLDIADVHGTGYPNSPTFISKRWGTSRPTARKDRDELIDLGYVEIRINDGVETLIPTAKTRDLVFYPLARSLLRGRGKRPRPAVLMAAAALLADTIGPRADRRGIRTDTERADAVGVSRSTIIEARNMLVNRGMIEVQIEFRGREKAIRLVRVVAARDARGNPMSSHGSPPSEERLDVAGQRAQRGRARLHGGGKSSDSGRGKPADHPCVAPRGSVPMQAPPAPRDGAAGRLEQDGSDRQQQPDRRPDRAVSPTPPPRGEPIAIAEVLADLVPDLPAAVADRQAERQRRHDRVRERLARADLAKLRRLPTAAGIAAVLGLADVDRVPGAGPRLAGRLEVRRRRRAVALAAAGLDADGVLEVAVDAATDQVRSVGAIVAQRCDRLASGAVGVRDVVRRSRRDLTLAARFAVLRGDAPDAPRPPELRDHDPHRRLALLAAAEAATRGDWPKVDAIALRHDLAVAEVSDAAGVDERELQQHLDDLGAERRARFAAGRVSA